MAFAKFQKNWFTIDREIAENHAILVNLTASIVNIVENFKWLNDNLGYLWLLSLFKKMIYKPVVVALADTHQTQIL